MKGLKPGLLVAISLLCLASAAPVFAAEKAKGTPGPLAGAGLPFLIAVGAAGAYKLIRRRRDHGGQDHGKVEKR